MKPIKIKQLSLTSLDARINYAVCGNTAALILPSSTIAPSSPAACTCDIQTGKLHYSDKRNKFIMESTLREMDDVGFRVACNENDYIVSSLSHQPDNAFGLTVMLNEMLDGIEEDQVMLCYGGDLVSNANTLQCIANAAAAHPEKKIVCKTGRGRALMTFSMESAWSNAIQPENVLFFQEDPGMEGNTLFPIISRKREGNVVDGPDFFPTEGGYVSLQLHEEAHTRRKKKVSWWQSAIAKKNRKK